eukprot:3474524-Pleurochrysis_carterae.AAC.1
MSTRYMYVGSWVPRNRNLRHMDTRQRRGARGARRGRHETCENTHSEHCAATPACDTGRC